MNLLQLFLKTQLPAAKKESPFSKSIQIYSGDKKLFVIGLGAIGGVITEEKKEEILLSMDRPESKIYFFTLFENKDAFQQNCDLISWGTYVWIGTDPEHTIHYDKNPKVKAREPKKLV